MDQPRPYMRESVKSLEKVFNDYAFNKKVLTAVRTELGFRTTKSAAALLLKVKQRLEEIEKRDRFGREKLVKVAPPVTPPPAQLPLIEKPAANTAQVERPVAPPPSPPRPQPATVSSPPKSTAPPPSKRDTQAKVKAEADRAVSVSLVGLIVLFAVIALLFSWGKKLNNDAPVEGAKLTHADIMRIRDKELDRIFGSTPQQGTRQPEALNKAQPQSFDERLKDYRNTVDALLN